MLAQRKLKPGQPGTKKLFEEYGSRLLCVRYRCDPESQSIIKTVEIIVEESARQPRQRRLKAEQLVALRTGWKEYDLQRQVRQSGARWNPAERLWELRYDQVVRLGLTERIVKKVSSTGKSKVSSTGN
ncbi:MAG TPA: hypothetical protein VNQ79_02755 [Blastocatellia bacterium]|nr:hypothetical protein [Blastocatellia bacterium]